MKYELNAFAFEHKTWENIFSCSPTALNTVWKGEKSVIVGDKAYLTEYNKNEDSLDVYVSEALSAAKHLEQISNARQEIYSLTSK